jgi:hypothetical protein
MDIVAAIHQTFTGAKGGRPRIKSEARSASIITIAFICADGICGSAAASTTRRASTPRTLRSGLSTASEPRPVAQVPSGWLTVITVFRIQSSISVSVLSSVLGTGA